MVQDNYGNRVDTPVPAWILAPYEEKALRAECQERTNEKCAEQFRKMGECVSKHQVLFSWYCPDLKKDLLDCVAHWGSHAEFEKLRLVYIEKKRDALRSEGKL